MHESFHKDDPRVFTRPWFSWANAMYAELALDVAGLGTRPLWDSSTGSPPAARWPEPHPPPNPLRIGGFPASAPQVLSSFRQASLRQDEPPFRVPVALAKELRCSCTNPTLSGRPGCRSIPRNPAIRRGWGHPGGRMRMTAGQLCRRKPLEKMVAEAAGEAAEPGGLRRSLGLTQLTLLGSARSSAPASSSCWAPRCPRPGRASCSPSWWPRWSPGSRRCATPNWRARSRWRAARTRTPTRRSARGPRTWSPGV